MLSALKVKCFQPNFAILFTLFFSTESEMLSAKVWHIFHMFFFTNSENPTKSKFSQETLNILSALKFIGSHLAFYDWKVSFSQISPIFFSLGKYNAFWSLTLLTCDQLFISLIRTILKNLEPTKSFSFPFQIFLCCSKKLEASQKCNFILL